MKHIKDRENPAIVKKAAWKWIFPVVAVLLLAAVLIIRQYPKRETEYAVIQAVIEGLSDYQDEIESWGYQVSVLEKMTTEPEEAQFMRYYWEAAGPVLILTDSNGGMYCFYYGFDQYASERTYTENMQLLPASQYDEKEYEDVRKTVLLQICKRDIKQEPLI